MEYRLKTMDREIRAIEESALRLKQAGNGVAAVEKNADAILSFVYILKKNITDLIEESGDTPKA